MDHKHTLVHTSHIMTEHSLLSFDEEVPPWEPLQPTSTPRGEDWQPLTPGYNLQGVTQFPDPQNPLRGDPMMGNVPEISPDMWIQHISAEKQANQDHELKIQEMQLAAQRERQEFELKRLRIQGEQNASLHSASRPSTTFRDQCYCPSPHSEPNALTVPSLISPP